ncbi:MAG: 5-(carboxyamino)imidazole ribonucleotide mutase [Bacteroidia bacterium]|nr:5-(carboxyamino)imidazole ribonucleotide mutase [Bacteroidia bacterium]MDW8347064.1 5-(carboxyamino)imidazole ribonucleotide mutase [Bacteroidia bacterium]
MNKSTEVGIIMGSESDLPVMQDAAETLDQFEVGYELTIISAHRTPLRMVDYAYNAHKRGLKVIIAGAGGAAHLPGMTASISPLPVIGVPIKTQALNGIDSLYSIVQMPNGVPVATVAINGAKNAALLAIEILGASNKILLEKMIEYKKSLQNHVENTAQELERIGYKAFLQSKK